MVVSHVNTRMANQSNVQWEQAKRLLRQLKGTADLALVYGCVPSSVLMGLSNTDYATDVDGRRSRT
jgi:hypothetical protein